MCAVIGSIKQEQCVGFIPFAPNLRCLRDRTDSFLTQTRGPPFHSAPPKQSLRRCAALVRKCARENAMLTDAKDYADALETGEKNSFDENGLTPLPSKVQEAVQSSSELKVTALRAQGKQAVVAVLATTGPEQ